MLFLVFFVLFCFVVFFFLCVCFGLVFAVFFSLSLSAALAVLYERTLLEKPN